VFPRVRLFDDPVPSPRRVSHQPGEAHPEGPSAHLGVEMNGMFKWMTVVSVAQVLAAFHPNAANAQGPITPGAMETGMISPGGDSDVWTISANVGDGIVIRIGDITEAIGFTPRIRLMSPGAVLMASQWDDSAAEVAVTATSSGIHTLIVDDAFDTTATGTYRLTLAHTGSAVTVSPGDEGGPLTNGALHTGAIPVGDLDVWTVTAIAGDAIVARMGELADGSALTPHVRIYSPSGALMRNSWGDEAAEAAVTATTSGTHLVVVGDHGTGYEGTGTYRLTLAHTGSAVTVSPGDEGGPLNAGLSTGIIDVGDLDVWTLTASAGEAIVVTLEEVAGAGQLTPHLRIYGPSGSLMRNTWGDAWAQASVTATVSGTHLVVVGDHGAGIAGVGGYRLTPSATTDAPAALRASELVFAPATPSPFSAHTVLRYLVPRTGATALRVYDPQGRLVRTLVDEAAQPAGEHEAAWDGRDAAGTKVRSGLYLARLDAGGRRLVQKLVVSH